MSEALYKVAHAALARAFDELVDAGLDPIVVAVEMARTALASLPDAACCRTCLVRALGAIGEELDAQQHALLEEARGEAAEAVEVRVH
jgi:hypothetical protein